MNSSILIITINYNQTNFTIQCVKSILDSEYENFRILLIDNGSLEENFNELKQNIPPDSRILLHRLEINKGYVGGVNFGLLECEKLIADYIIIMNNDVIIDSKSILELVKTSKKWNNKAIVTGKCYYYDTPDMLQTVGFKFKNEKTLTTYKIGEGELDIGQYDKESERDLIDDVYWLFPSDLVNVIGLYPNYYGFGHEQADWAMAAKKNGYKLVYTPEAKLLHKVNGTVGNKLSPFKIYWYLQGHLMFQWKYISKLSFAKCYLLTIIEILAAFYYEVIRLFSNSIETRFPFIKLIAFIRFHFWLIFKMDKDKFNPKIINRS
jgi:GT2 family glycosyltransferase